jgi:hypothetical protein
MGLLVNCPPAAKLSDVSIEDCPFTVGQTQKVLFQRLFVSPGVKNSVTTPATLASWTPLLTASDNTRVVPSPYIQSPENEPGAARKYGGGNTTLGGVEIIVGREPTNFTAQILSTKQGTIKQLKTYQGENVGVYLVDEFGRIAGLKLDETATVYPIPIRAFFVSDLKLGQLESPEMNSVEWQFNPNWSDNLTISTPTDFNGLDLVSPSA